MLCVLNLCLLIMLVWSLINVRTRIHHWQLTATAKNFGAMSLTCNGMWLNIYCSYSRCSSVLFCFSRSPIAVIPAFPMLLCPRLQGKEIQRQPSAWMWVIHAHTDWYMVSYFVNRFCGSLWLHYATHSSVWDCMVVWNQDTVYVIWLPCVT